MAMFLDSILSNVYLDPKGKCYRKIAKFKNNRMFINVFCRLVSDALSVNKYEGLPDTISERVVQETMLYHGAGAIIKSATINGTRHEFTSPIFLPAPPADDWSVYGEPGYGNAFTRNGQVFKVKFYIPGSPSDKMLATGISGQSLGEQFDAVYIRANRLEFPAIEYCIQYAEAISDCYRALDLSRRWIKRPFMVFCDETSVESVKQVIEDRDDNVENIITMLDPSRAQIQTLDTNPQNIKACTDLVEWYTDQFYQSIGIQANANPDKKAQLTEDEIHSNDEATLLQGDKVIDFQQSQWDIANEILGTNIRVSKNEVTPNEQADKDNSRDMGRGFTDGNSNDDR